MHFLDVQSPGGYELSGVRGSFTSASVSLMLRLQYTMHFVQNRSDWSNVYGSDPVVRKSIVA